jgi:L-ribulose-5-phosphate 3-epimerase
MNLWTVYGWNSPGLVGADVIRAIGAMGAQGVELILDEEESSLQQLTAHREDLSGVVEDSGLEVPSIATTLFWRYNLASQDDDLRRRGIEIIREGCETAQAFGAGVFLVVAGQQERRTEYARSYDTAVESVREGAQYAADSGIMIGVENVLGNFLCSPGEYAQFIADVDHPSVQAYVDFGNGMSLGSGYPENWITALRGGIAMVHAKDYDRALRAYVCCGQGDLSWEHTFAALAEVGYDGYLVVETPPRGGRGQPSRASGLQAAETSLRWLARFARAFTE